MNERIEEVEEQVDSVGSTGRDLWNFVFIPTAGTLLQGFQIALL